MSNEPTKGKDPAEAILDELLDDLAEFFPGAMREEARDFVLDAVAAHPVTRILAENVRPRAVPDRSGEAASPDAKPQTPVKKTESSK